MLERAKEGTCLATLVRMAIPVCQEAERRCPRTGPGRKPEIPDWLMAVLIMVVVANRKKTKSAQYRFLLAHRKELLDLLDANRFPCRSTYFDRYRRAYRLFESAIHVEGEKAIQRGLCDGSCVAVDKSLVHARGPLWHKKLRRKKIVLRGVDRESTWGYSKHQGWVQGYGYEVVVTAPKNGTVWPLLASVDPACSKEQQPFAQKIGQLPKPTKYVLADSAYDTNTHADAIERDDDGHRTGRRFLCPLNRRNTSDHPPTYRMTYEYQRQREHREKRGEYLKTPKGRRLYARRTVSVEPFNEWFKSLFEVNDRVWHRGLDNNRTQLLAAVFVYQLLLRYNRRRRRQNGQIRWILDTM